MRKKRTLGVLALLFILVGIILILENFGVLMGISKLWPVILLLLGLGFVMLFFERKKQDTVLLWIGSFLMMVSVLFGYLNHTSWMLLAYLWPVFLALVGLSFFFISFYTEGRVFRYLTLGFFGLFLALFFVFTVSLRLWPVSLIVFGLSLIVVDYFNKREVAKKK